MRAWVRRASRAVIAAAGRLDAGIVRLNGRVRLGVTVWLLGRTLFGSTIGYVAVGVRLGCLPYPGRVALG